MSFRTAATPLIVAGLLGAAAARSAAAAELPSVASINLCTDQLVLTVAEPEQILSVSWLSADPEESMLADAARRYPLNYGMAEELIRIAPDVVVAGSETSPFAKRLLRQLGLVVVEVPPASNLAEVALNLRTVGAALERSEETERIVAAMQERVEAIRVRSGAGTRSAIVVRPGGFTVGRGTLADELMRLAGLDNGVADLDRWGSLSVEALLASRPEIIVIADYRRDEPALANRIFDHPALSEIEIAEHTVTVASKYWACGAPASLRSAELIQTQLSQAEAGQSERDPPASTTRP